MRNIALAVLALGLLPLPVAAVPDATVHEYRLDNGMKVFVKQDHRAPVVVSQVWYKVGASYEHNGITGLSHMLEHMMFKGTEELGPGEFSRVIAAQGGKENAFTGRDYTAYYQRLASDRLEISLRLEADRMANLLLREQDFLKEREVVAEERRLRTEDKPESLTYESFMSVAHQTNPYQNPVIGWMGDIQSYALQDLQQWYRHWYAPNNAALVVVGDVQPERVRDLARKHFGPLQPADTPDPKPRPEVEQRGQRRLSVKAPAELPYLIMGYQVPSLATAEQPWEAYALEVLAAVLDGDDSARLTRHLVRGQELAASAGADYSLYARLSTLLSLDASPAPGHAVAELEQALHEQVRRLREQPVSEKELDKIKTQVVASDVYQRDSVFYQAMRIGLLETVGLGWRTGEQYVQAIRAVTPEQVQAVARKYLTQDRLTVGVLEPQPIGEREPPSAAAGGRHGA